MFGHTQDQLPRQSYSVVDACLDIFKISTSAVLFNSGCMFGHTQDQLPRQSYSVVDARLNIFKISYLTSLIQ